MPSMWFYGIAGGIGGDPGMMIPRLLGAVIGRFYMIKQFGLKRWFMFNPVLAAGFACGVGLIGMATVAIALGFESGDCETVLMHFHERRKRVFFEGSGSLGRLCTSKRDNRQCQSSIEEKQGHLIIWLI